MANGQVSQHRLSVHKIRIDLKMGGTGRFKIPFVNNTAFLSVDKIKPSCGGCIRDIDMLQDGIEFTYKDLTKESEFVTEDGGQRVAIEQEKYINVVYVNDQGDSITPLWIQNDRGVDIINYLNRPWEQVTLDIKITK